MRNALFALFVGGVLAYGAGLAWYGLSRFDIINLVGDVNTDDAFYYFQIAWNLADGQFSTFDGGITRTNGYHPLWMFLVTPFYWVLDKEAALFGIKAFEIMLIAGGAALIVLAARLARLPWVLLFTTLPLLYQKSSMFQGMEAAAGLFMLGLFFLAVILYARNPERWKWPLAAVAFALPWVRLEYIAISLAVTAAMGLIEWSRRERTPGASLGVAIVPTLSSAFVPIVGAVAGLLVYFAYNWLVFGGITPVSGATKRAWSQVMWEQEGGYSLAQNFRDTLQIHAFDIELLIALAVCACLPIVWCMARRSRLREDRLLLAFLVGMFGLAAGHLAKFVQTVLTIHPSQGGWQWYFVPAYLMMALCVPVACYLVIHFLRLFIGPRSPGGANVLSAGIVLVAAVFLLAKADFAGPFRYVDARVDSNVLRGEWDDATYDGVQVINRALPEGSVVGSWDAGVIGYLSRFPVVNLDGVVNSYDYFDATDVESNGYALWNDKFIPVYQEFGITHFANMTKMGFDGNAVFIGSLPVRGQRFNVRSVAPLGDDYGARLWERMEPSFDYQSEGVGLIVDGRMAQAFAQGCAPGDLAVLVWGGPEGETSATANLYRNQTGLCVAALVLPRDALPPVRVERERATVDAGGFVRQLTGDRWPLIRSDFDVYFIENRLVYVKEQCVEDDIAATFFLHVYPVDADDLPGNRKQYGFDNLDFGFDRHGAIFDGICLADVQLPEYAIAEIRTGQYAQVDGGFIKNLWGDEIHIVE